MAQKALQRKSRVATPKASSPFFSKKGSEDFFGQAKLSINKPGDPYEREADDMADRVVQQSSNEGRTSSRTEMPQRRPLVRSITPLIQRSEAETGEEERVQRAMLETPVLQRQEEEEEPIQLQQEEEEEVVQRQEEEEESIQMQAEEEEEAIQTKSDVPMPVPSLLRSRLSERKGNGEKLSEEVQGFMESGFGSGFQDVRIHTDSEAESMAKSIRAKAFTHGYDIYFGPRQFQPDTLSGKHLLAHELTHAIQQRGRKPIVHKTVPNKPGKPGNAPISLLKLPAQITTEPNQENKPNALDKNASDAVPKLDETGKDTPANPIVEVPLAPKDNGKSGEGKPNQKTPTAPEEDPKFQTAKKQVKKEARKQRRHQPPATKRKESVAASALTNAEQMVQDGKEVNTGVMSDVGDRQREKGKQFSAEAFKKDLKARIEKEKPRSESQAKAFAKNPPVENFEQEFSAGIADKQSEVTKPLEDKAVPNPPGGKVQKEAIPIPKPKSVKKPEPIDGKLARPKPKTDKEVSLQHESDRMEKAMKDQKLSDDQLVQSREPKFIETHAFKEQAHQKVKEAEEAYRNKETTMLNSAEGKANQDLSNNLQAMNTINRKANKKVFDGQGKNETKTEKRQREIKKTIDDIYKGTVDDVTTILGNMASSVKEDFAKNLKDQTDAFNESLRSRISDYYGDWRIDDKLFGPDPVIVNDDGSTTTYSMAHRMLNPNVETINPDVYRIFVQEKDKFIEEMDVKLDAIAEQVETGLNAAFNRINKGRFLITLFKAGLTGQELIYANQLEEEVSLKFENLESRIHDTREDLLDSLASDYKANVDQLFEMAKEINDELKKSWIDRAIDFIVTVGKTIFELAQLLLSIIVRMAHLIWGIIKHPIRFFETLVTGLKDGIKSFITNAGTYLKEAFWGWITGASPVANIKLSADSGAKGMFGMVVQVLRMGLQDIRVIVDRILGPRFMRLIDQGIAFGEKAMEPIMILLKEGPAAFWEYIKDTIAETVESKFNQIRESVFETFIEKGLLWIAGFFIPGGGFVKIIKAIFKAFQFVSENMANIRHFFDAVFDSMEAAVNGDSSGVKNKIVEGLKTGVRLALGFLAKVLGVDQITRKVQKLIQSLRRPIVRAIELILRKVKPLVNRIVNGIEKLKDKGKAMVDKAKGKVMSWMGFRQKVTTQSGNTHTLYIQQKGNKTQLIIESNPTEVQNYFVMQEQRINQDETIEVSEKKQKLGQITHGKNLMQGVQALMNNPGQTEQQQQQSDTRIPQMIAEVIGIIREIDPNTSTNLVPPAQWGPHTDFVNNVPPITAFSARHIYGGGTMTRPDGTPQTVPPNHEAGSEPENSTLSDAMDILRGLRLTLFGKWVRFHIFNENIGGKGRDSNLIPTPKYVNQDYLGTFETPIKGYHDRGLPVWMNATISYRSIYGGHFVQDYNAQGGAMMLRNNQWVEDSSKEHRFRRTIEEPQAQSVNINEVVRNNEYDSVLANSSSMTLAFIRLLRANQPSGGYQRFVQMEKVVASDILGGAIFEVPSLDMNTPGGNRVIHARLNLETVEELINGGIISANQASGIRTRIRNARTALDSVNWFYG